jgi:putative membrane protein
MIPVVISSITGALIGSVFACIPGLHVYNVMALAVIALHLCGVGGSVSPDTLVSFAAGMIVGYSMLNTVPSVLLAAPDESAIFTVLPGQKYLMRGHGYEGAMITAAGGLAGLFLVVFGIGLLGPKLLPLAKAVLHPHYHWILWAVIAFMLMSEWPMEGRLGQAGLAKFRAAWGSLGVGLLTFLMSGFLGFILFYRSPISIDVSFQNLMPAFAGLFTIPSLLLNIVSNVKMPKQRRTFSKDLDAAVLLKGAFAGGLGGGFAAFFPAITGGVGGLLAGHATAWRDDRIFLVSQGTSKLVYYVGGFLLLFVPGLNMTRGGGAWMLRGLYQPHTNHDYYIALAALAFAGAISFLLVSPLARGSMAIISKVGYRRISCVALAAIVALVGGLTGLMGVLVMLVATGIGLLPVLYGARRMNCLGIILLPVACNMSGIGPTVAGWIGLL